MLSGITVLTALVCIMLMGVVLIQNPKGGGVDATFGGNASNQIFGAAKSTDFVEKFAECWTDHNKYILGKRYRNSEGEEC